MHVIFVLFFYEIKINKKYKYKINKNISKKKNKIIKSLKKMINYDFVIKLSSNLKMEMVSKINDTLKQKGLITRIFPLDS